MQHFSETFERQVIFRLARWLPLGLGGIATLGLVICILILAYAFLPSLKPQEPKDIPAPKPVTVSTQEIAEHLKPASVSDHAMADTAAADAERATATEATATTKNPQALQLAQKIGMLNQLFIKRGLSMIDVSESQCSYRDYYGDCMQWQDVVVKKGEGQGLFEVFALYDDQMKIEPVEYQIPQSDLTVKLREDTGLEAKNAAAQELINILSPLSAKQTLSYYHAWVDLRKDKEQQQRQEHQDQQTQQFVEYQDKMNAYDEKNAQKQALKTSSWMGLLGALATLVFAGLVLAVIAIERHSRAMNKLLVNLPSQAPAVPSSASTEL